MHEFGFLVPIGVVSAVMASRAFTTWVRAKHGYPLERESRRRRRFRAAESPVDYPGGLDDSRKMALLSSENERLAGQVTRLEERIAVLERIATDPAERTARAIDALR